MISLLKICPIREGDFTNLFRELLILPSHASLEWILEREEAEEKIWCWFRGYREPLVLICCECCCFCGWVWVWDNLTFWLGATEWARDGTTRLLTLLELPRPVGGCGGGWCRSSNSSSLDDEASILQTCPYWNQIKITSRLIILLAKVQYGINTMNESKFSLQPLLIPFIRTNYSNNISYPS